MTAKRQCPYDDPNCTGKHSSASQEVMCPSAYEKMRDRQAEYYRKHKKVILSYRAEWRKEHKEALVSYNAEYYKEHKDAMDSYFAEYRKEHREVIASYHADYYKANKEAIAYHDAEYRRLNKEVIAFRNAEYLKTSAGKAAARKGARLRRERKRNCEGLYTDLTYLPQICTYCGETVGEFHADHVYPLALNDGTIESYLVWACKACNLSKHDNPPTEFQLARVADLIITAERRNQDAA